MAVAAPPRGSVRVVVTVDWEGRALETANLDQMKALRATYPTIPFVQFLNIAYYLKQGADPEAIDRAIRSVIRWFKYSDTTGNRFDR